MAFETLHVEHRDRILFVTIQRPKALNALNATVLNELDELFATRVSQPDVAGVMLTGSGEKAFVAGADIAEFVHWPAEEGGQLAERGQAVFRRIETCSKPVVAAINGFALGGGCELAMACHLRVASENARFGQPEVKLGLIPGYGGTQRLVQLVGKTKAMELILTADMIDAAEALRIGLLNAVVPLSDLLSAAEKLLRRITAHSPVAIRASIAAVNAYFDSPNGYASEAELFGQCFASPDKTEGVAAFLEKRSPNFGA